MSSIQSRGRTVALALLVIAGSLGLTEAKRHFSNVHIGTTQGVDDLDTLTRAGRHTGGSAGSNGALFNGALFIEDQVAPLSDQIKAAVAKLNDTTPVGLAIEVENGAGMPLRLRQGQRFFINQVDIRSFVMTSVNQGIDAITESGDFASLNWSGLELDESEPLLLPNPDGTFTTRSFYRGATWMNRRSFVRIW